MNSSRTRKRGRVPGIRVPTSRLIPCDVDEEEEELETTFLKAVGCLESVAESVELVEKLASGVDDTALRTGAVRVRRVAKRLEVGAQNLEDWADDEGSSGCIDEEVKTDLLDDWKSEDGSETKEAYFMISSQHPARVAWDVVLSVLLIFILVVEPMALGFWNESGPLEIVNIVIDVYFILDLILNFRTGYVVRDGIEIMDPRQCATHYLKTWFFLDFVSSVPPVLDLVLRLIATGLPGASSLKSAKLLKLGRVFKGVKVLRLGKLVRFSDTKSPMSDFIDDFLSSSSSLFALRLVTVLFCALLLAHLLACFMAISGDGWFEGYAPRGSSADSWDWRRRYLVAFYFAFSTMSTVGYGDVVPQSDAERIYVVIAMLIGVSFYSYMIATVSSMVTAADAKSAIYFDKMDQLSSWMRHYRFGSVLRRRTRAFFKRFYAQRSAIDERTILENLAPKLQQDVSAYLLHDFVKQHPLFQHLPEGVLWKVLMIVKRASFDAGARVALRDDASVGLYIMLAGRAKATYSIHDGPVRRKSRSRSHILGAEVVSIGPGNSFGELCLLGAATKSLVTVTTSSPSEFFLIQRDAFLDAFTNLPEVLDSMVAQRHIFVGKPIWKINRHSEQLELHHSPKKRSRSMALKERPSFLLTNDDDDDCQARPSSHSAGTTKGPPPSPFTKPVRRRRTI